MPSTPVHDRSSLLAQARAGDELAWERLFSPCAERLVLFVRLRLGSALRERLEVEDLVQETYAAALEALPRYEDRGEEGLVRWLCRIAENCIRAQADHFGARKRQPPGRLARISSILEAAHLDATGPATAAARSERRQRLGQAIARLDPDEQQVVLKRFFLGSSLDELATGLGRTESGVRRLLGRALARLGDELSALSSSATLAP